MSEAGYKNPPKEFQFRKGVSGNPSGRPKGRRTFAADMAAALDAAAEHRPGLTAQQAITEMLVKKASAGDFKAIDRLLPLLQHLEKTSAGSDPIDDAALADDLALVKGAQEKEVNDGEP